MRRQEAVTGYGLIAFSRGRYVIQGSWSVEKQSCAARAGLLLPLPGGMWATGKMQIKVCFLGHPSAAYHQHYRAWHKGAHREAAGTHCNCQRGASARKVPSRMVSMASPGTASASPEQRHLHADEQQRAQCHPCPPGQQCQDCSCPLAAAWHCVPASIVQPGRGLAHDGATWAAALGSTLRCWEPSGTARAQCPLQECSR